MGLVYDIFQIQTWGLTPAQICFLRNEAGAATGSINNVRGELAALSTVAGGGELASEIQRAGSADDCRNYSTQLRGFAGNLPNRDVALAACDAGYGVGIGWSICRPDGSNPALWPQESQSAYSEFSRAIGAYQSLCQTLPQMDKQLVFQMTSLQNDIVSTNTTPYDIRLFNRFQEIIGGIQGGLQRAGL